MFLTACNFMDQKTTPDTSLSTKTISYKKVMNDLFAQNCVSCHGANGKAGVDLETCDNVIANIQKIRTQVLINKTMPPDGDLSDYEMQVLTVWLEAGAPDDAGGPPEIAPILPSPIPSYPPETPVDANYDSIRDNIFAARCVSCHSADGKAKDVNLMDYAALLAGTPKDPTWVVPSSPATSDLYKDITVTSAGNPPQDGAQDDFQDDSRMPPFSTGPSLSTVQINVIRTWIQNGAPQTGPQILPTFSSIRDNIFTSHCTTCHNPKGVKVDIMDYAALTDPSQKWIIAGHPETSQLYVAITSHVKGRMPPYKAGPPLSDEEIQIIQSWIQSGAPNN
jgi:mono/diheme cytochrome c family protein